MVNAKKISQIFSIENDIIDDIDHLMEGKLKNKVVNDKIDPHFLPEFGKKLGFFKRSKTSQVITFFTTKGGVLKTTRRKYSKNGRTPRSKNSCDWP